MQTSLKTKVFNLIPPAMIAVVLAFWAWGPEPLLENPWTLTVTSLLIVLTVLLLEQVHERHAGWRMNRQELFTDLSYTVLSATLIVWLTEKLAENPLKAAKASLGITTEWTMHLPWLAQVALVIVVFEFGQYWMHRLMHNAHPFWMTHAVHHHITQLNAAKGAVGNPIELFLISLGVIVLFDLETTAVFGAVNAMGVITVFAHANVRSDPPRWYSFFFTTIQHHSLHHSVDFPSTRCNYGNALILLDRIFGTYRAGESAVVGQDDRKRLTVREQTLFPFQPMIDRYRTRRANAGAGGEVPANGPAERGDAAANHAREAVRSAATA